MEFEGIEHEDDDEDEWIRRGQSPGLQRRQPRPALPSV